MKRVNDEFIKQFVSALLEAASNNSEQESSTKKEDTESKFNYDVVTADEILQMEGDSLPYLVDPLFPKQGLVGFGGSSDTGKSTFLKQLAVAISRGESEFLGFPLHIQHRSVIYVSTEDDIHAVKTVLKKQKKKGSRSTAVKGLRFLFNSENIYRQIKAELNRQRADLVIIDAFSDIIPGDLNQSNVVRPFLDKFSNLSKQHETLFIFLHHTSKKSEGTVPKKGNLLGSQGFEAKCRLVSLLVRDPSEDNVRHFCLVKGNYLPDEFKTKSYVLSFREDLTFDYTGERVDLEALSYSEDQFKKKKETEELKKQAFELRNKGWKLETIAIDLNRDKSTISRWLADFKAEDNSSEILEQNIPILKEKLAEFITESKDYKDLHEFKSKYKNASRGFQESIRSKFKKFLGTKKGVKKITFEKVLEE